MPCLPCLAEHVCVEAVGVALTKPAYWQAQLGEDDWKPPKPYHEHGESESNHVPSKLHFVERDDAIKDLLINWFRGLREFGRKRSVGGLSHESG